MPWKPDPAPPPTPRFSTGKMSKLLDFTTNLCYNELYCICPKITFREVQALKDKPTNTAVTAPKKRPVGNFWYDFVKITGLIPGLIWIRPKVIRTGGKTPRGGVLISSNHPTFLDPIILLASIRERRLHSLATTDLFSSKFKTFMFTRMHCIPVDKTNFSMTTFHEVVDRLKAGKAVVIFPEGQVNRNGGQEIRAFKSGAILMAHRAGAPVLPVYIVRREKWYRPQYVVVGEPFDVRAAVGPSPTMEQVERVCDQLREKELNLKHFYEEKYQAK